MTRSLASGAVSGASGKPSVRGRIVSGRSVALSGGSRVVFGQSMALSDVGVSLSGVSVSPNCPSVSLSLVAKCLKKGRLRKYALFPPQAAFHHEPFYPPAPGAP